MAKIKKIYTTSKKNQKKSRNKNTTLLRKYKTTRQNGGSRTPPPKVGEGNLPEGAAAGMPASTVAEGVAIENRRFNNNIPHIKDLIICETGINKALVDGEIKILSAAGNTASNATVYLVKLKSNGKRYIVKEVLSQLYGQDYKQFIINELIVYDLMKKFITYKITPFVIGGHTFKECAITKDQNQDQNNSQEESSSKYYIINEAHQENVEECISLKNFLNKYYAKINKFILFNLLAQIIYTLDCFGRVKLQHSDLHLANILVYVFRKNIFQEGFEIKEYNTYGSINSNPIEKNKIYNIGIEIRIFDFDQANKYPIEKTETIYGGFTEKTDPRDAGFNPAGDLYKFMRDFLIEFLWVIIPKKLLINSTIIDEIVKDASSIIYILLNYVNIDSTLHEHDHDHDHKINETEIKFIYLTLKKFYESINGKALPENAIQSIFEKQVNTDTQTTLLNSNKNIKKKMSILLLGKSNNKPIQSILVYKLKIEYANLFANITDFYNYIIAMLNREFTVNYPRIEPPKRLSPPYKYPIDNKEESKGSWPPGSRF
jgi:hypothetical protein